MSKTRRGLAEEPHQGRGGNRTAPEYRAITQGTDRDEWAVVDREGTVIYLGDARVAAMIASRLTDPAA